MRVGDKVKAHQVVDSNGFTWSPIGEVAVLFPNGDILVHFQAFSASAVLTPTEVTLLERATA